MGILDTQEKVTYNGETSEVVIRKKSGNKLRTPFAAIGPLTNIKYKRRAMQADVFDLLDRVSKGAFSVFRKLKYNRSVENNLALLPPDIEMTRTQKETLSRRYKELKAVGLIRLIKGPLLDTDGIRTFTVRKGTFIINPELIRCINHDEAEYFWSQCAQGEKNGSIGDSQESD
jgi:hypothetical protein